MQKANKKNISKKKKIFYSYIQRNYKEICMEKN